MSAEDLDTTFFTFATDFADEGMEACLDRVQEAHVSGVNMAVVYHHARDIFTHNPRRKVHFHEGGAAFFEPDYSLYGDNPLRPRVSRLTSENDIFSSLRRETARRGMALNAWAVLNHNSPLAKSCPSAAVQNAFGDPQLTYLCPANPLAIRYIVALTQDLARFGIESLIAEALHFMPFEHGYHHERYLMRIGPLDRLLLGLCFCQYCLGRAEQYGVRTSQFQKQVVERLERVFASDSSYDPTEATPAAIDVLWDGELAAFLRSRAETVSSLAAKVVEALAGTGTRFVLMDHSGAIAGYQDGLPAVATTTDLSLRIGLDLTELATICDQIQVLGYAQSPERMRSDLASYLSLVGCGDKLRVCLRPMSPDCYTTANLSQKVSTAPQLGVKSIDFYHYGLARSEDISMVGQSLPVPR